MGHVRCKCKKYDAVSHGLCCSCIGAALAELESMHNEFDLRLVSGSGPMGVHVPTWEAMQPAVDAMGDAIAKLCAEIAEEYHYRDPVHNIARAISMRIQEQFKVKV